MLGPFWGLIGTVFGMKSAFQELASPGATDPQALSGAIGHTLLATVAGIIACPIGIILLIVCIVKLTNTPKASRALISPPPASSPNLPS